MGLWKFKLSCTCICKLHIYLPYFSRIIHDQGGWINYFGKSFSVSNGNEINFCLTNCISLLLPEETLVVGFKVVSLVRKNLQQRIQFTEMISLVRYRNQIFPMWEEIIFYNFLSFQSVKSFQYKRFLQTACLMVNISIITLCIFFGKNSR